MIRITVRDLIWVYFWCLILEGAFRKWFLPGLSAPLLIIRDPIVILIYIISLRNGSFPWNTWVFTLFIIGTLMVLFGLFATELNLYVLIFGLRTNILHIPLCFIMAQAINREQFEKIGNWIISLLFPMGVLMVFQFISSPDHFINTTAGGEGEQIGGTEGNIRPPATFSFITGAAEYLALSCAVMIGLFLQRNAAKNKIGQLFIFGCTGLLLGLSVSISRLALGYVALVVAMLGLILVLHPSYFYRLLGVILSGAIIFMLMLDLDFIKQGLSSFSQRIVSAGDAEKETGGFLGRVKGDYIAPFTNTDNVSDFGYGLGMGTAAGAKLMTGERAFLLAEVEWSRNIMESGPYVGVIFIVWRVMFASWLGFLSLRSALYGYPIPLLIFGACNQLILIGQISRPTTLGFAVFGTGLCLVAIRLANEDYQRNKGSF